jgi:hypothetical protein
MFYPQFISEPHVIASAINVMSGKTEAEKVLKHLAAESDSLLRTMPLFHELINRFGSDGFYKWEGIRYFLFEYNLDLQTRSKTKRPKIFWPEFTESKSDYISVEHIYPRHARHAYWMSRFSGLTQKQRTMLRHSLGNLLPLSKPKNSSLSNNPFPQKVEGNRDAVVGYRYGSYAENEVAVENEWTPKHILDRGLKMLKFMEQRWDIQLGSEKDKIKMLGLSFMLRTKGAKKPR